MASPSESTRYQHQKQLAIRSAASVFAEKGFHGASTRDIAERMGIKQGSLYYYFKSKEDALGEVCLYGIEDYVEMKWLMLQQEEPEDFVIATGEHPRTVNHAGWGERTEPASDACPHSSGSPMRRSR